jgi:hypothetical protein
MRDRDGALVAWLRREEVLKGRRRWETSTPQIGHTRRTVAVVKPKALPVPRPGLWV